MTAEVQPQKAVTLREAAKILGTNEVYVRTMLRKGQLAGAFKEPVSEGSPTQRWMIPLATIEARKATARKSRREDGRNKYDMYATPEEFKAIQASLQKAGIKAVIQKPKHYVSKKSKAKAVKAEATEQA